MIGKAYKNPYFSYFLPVSRYSNGFEGVLVTRLHTSYTIMNNGVVYLGETSSFEEIPMSEFLEEFKKATEYMIKEVEVTYDAGNDL